MLAQPTRKCIIYTMNKYGYGLVKDWYLILVSFLLIFVYGCSTKVTPQTPTSTKSNSLLHYSSPTFTITPKADDSGIALISDTPVPTLTPTPTLYQIVQGDTFSSIAYQHGVKVSDLITANPEIDPNFIPIGISVTIPITGSNTIFLLEPTPISIHLDLPICYPQLDNGLTCISEVRNTQSFDVENVTARITLNIQDTLTQYEKETITPLNLLRSGSKLPISVNFPPPIPQAFQTHIDLITVLPVDFNLQRWLDLEMDINSIFVSESKLQSIVSGTLLSPPQNPTANRVWIVAVAYDISGSPVGYRKWQIPNPLLGGGITSFKINVFSLGPTIEQVEVFYEAQP